MRGVDRAGDFYVDPSKPLIAYYLTHPQVAVDPSIPVPSWSLSDIGRARMAAALSKPWWRSLGRIVSSDERKAVETADMIAATTGAESETWVDMGENDRSSTGFLPPERFEAAADAFFANPCESWNGWETAIDAQMRITGAVETILAGHDGVRPLLFVGHGAVGTLLKCSIGGLSIDRCQDQPAGSGNIFAFALDDRRLLCDWTPIESFEGAGNVHRDHA